MGRRATGRVEVLATCLRLRFTVAGRRVNETLDLAPTPANIKAARRTLADVLAAIQAGVYRREVYFEGAKPQHVRTFREYAEAWLSTLTIEKSTRRSYATALRATWYPAFGDKAVVSRDVV